MPSLSVTTVRSVELPPVVVDEWRALFATQSAPANPFLHPAWILGWLRTYGGEPVIMLVRRDDTGELVGLAAHWVQSVALGPMKVARRLLPVGSGFTTPLELPGILASPGCSRDVARVVVAAALAESDTDWQELALPDDQGWFEPEWIFGEAPITFGTHVRSRACVVLPLAETWANTRSALKRNVKESVRRSTNRLAKLTECTEVRTVTGGELDRTVVDRFFALHQSRSDHDGSGIDHHDAYADPRHREFLREVLPEVARDGLATIFELRIDGEVMAAQLALRAPATSYVHSSGFDPAVWALGPTTLLQAELIRTGVDLGDRVVNFSPGPSVSKLRWSEQLWLSSDFAYGAGGRSLALRYGAFSTLRSVRSTVDAIRFARRQRPADSAPAAGSIPATGPADRESTPPAVPPSVRTPQPGSAANLGASTNGRNGSAREVVPAGR